MSPTTGPLTPTTPSFPRVSGDEPESLSATAKPYSFSPRERG